MLRGHSRYDCSPMTEVFLRVLEKCDSVNKVRLVSRSAKGARTREITLSSSMPKILYARLRDGAGTFWYRVVVQDGISLLVCCGEITRLVKKQKPGIVVRVNDNIKQYV